MNQLSLFSTPEVEAMNTASVFEDEGQMQIRAPALFATSAHPKMSERYSFTNTYDIVLHMHRRGFRVSSVQGGATRYRAVLVRMRCPGYDKRDEAPEIIIMDSHDGSKRLKSALGFIKFLCMNGMIAGDILYSRAYKHTSPDLMANVLLDLDDIQPHIAKLVARIDVMKAYNTSIGERIALADEAIKSRWEGDRSASFIATMRQSILAPRRSEDMRNDMYTVMNVIQENVMRGGMTYHINNTVRRVNALSAVGRNMSINQQLWLSAEEIIGKRAIGHVIDQTNNITQ